jgi:hypothetical protein
VSALKERVNRVLSARFGYQLHKVPPGAAAGTISDDAVGAASRGREAALQRQLRAARRRANQAERRAQVAEEQRDWLAVSGEPWAVSHVEPFELEAGVAEIVDAVRPYTSSDSESIGAVVDAARYVARWQIGNAIVDYGGDGGGVIQAIARALVEMNDTTRQLCVIAGSDDRADAGEIKRLVEAAGYPSERVQGVTIDPLQQAWDQVGDSIALCRVSVGAYREADIALHQLWDRLSPGGVLMIDGFDTGKAATRVMTEMLDRLSEPALFVRTGNSRVTVRPRI